MARQSRQDGGFDLRSSVTVETGIDLLDPWHGITTWNIASLREEIQALFFQLGIQISDDLRQSTFSVNEMFTGILQKQCQRSCLLGVDQLLHIAEVHFRFSNREAVFAVNFGFQSFRLARAAVAGWSSFGSGHDTMAFRQAKRWCFNV